MASARLARHSAPDPCRQCPAIACWAMALLCALIRGVLMHRAGSAEKPSAFDVSAAGVAGAAGCRLQCGNATQPARAGPGCNRCLKTIPSRPLRLHWWS